MTLHTRRFIYLSFVLLFFIVAPVTVLYTTGYRWNYYKYKLEKIGNLVIRTVPRKVHITLNDETWEKTTPWRFNNLLSNNYTINVSLDGYYSWEKTLPVNSGETTFAEHIYLFKKDLNTQQILSKLDFWTYQPSLELILSQKNNKLEIHNLNNQQTQIISDLPDIITTADWSPDMQTLLLTTPTKYYFWRTNEPTKLQPISTNPITDHCHLHSDNAIALVCASNKQLFELNPYTNTQSQLVPEIKGEVIDFYASEGTIYFLEKDETDGNVYLRITKPNFPNTTYPDYLLPDSNSYKFISVQNDQAVILDQAHKKLYLLSLENNEYSFNRGSQIFNDINQAFFAPDGSLIFFNDWEVWTRRNEQTALITRQSGSIQNVLWFVSNNHLLLVQSDSLEFIELDERDQRNRSKIVESTNIKNVQFTKTGTKILYSTESEGKQNLFTGDILPTDAGDLLPN